jgi:hypothetical protein
MENTVDVVTFRAWGADLALPFEAVAGIHRAAEGLAVAEPPLGLLPGAGAQRFVQVETNAGAKGIPVEQITAVTRTVVERVERTPAWALGVCRCAGRDVTVIDPRRV